MRNCLLLLGVATSAEPSSLMIPATLQMLYRLSSLQLDTNRPTLLSHARVCGAPQLCKSLFLELDKHLHEVLAPRLDELGMRRYGPAWPTVPEDYSPELATPDPIRQGYALEAGKRRRNET